MPLFLGEGLKYVGGGWANGDYNLHSNDLVKNSNMYMYVCVYTNKYIYLYIYTEGETHIPQVWQKIKIGELR